uniref:Uncharacterized protein n=1 Tax=Setaria italica TaxID=4555 RepID=K3ZJA4_SETIT
MSLTSTCGDGFSILRPMNWRKNTGDFPASTYLCAATDSPETRRKVTSGPAPSLPVPHRFPRNKRSAFSALIPFPTLTNSSIPTVAAALSTHSLFRCSVGRGSPIPVGIDGCESALSSKQDQYLHPRSGDVLLLVVMRPLVAAASGRIRPATTAATSRNRVASCTIRRSTTSASFASRRRLCFASVAPPEAKAASASTASVICRRPRATLATSRVPPTRSRYVPAKPRDVAPGMRPPRLLGNVPWLSSHHVPSALWKPARRRLSARVASVSALAGVLRRTWNHRRGGTPGSTGGRTGRPWETCLGLPSLSRMPARKAP